MSCDHTTYICKIMSTYYFCHNTNVAIQKHSNKAKTRTEQFVLSEASHPPRQNHKSEKKNNVNSYSIICETNIGIEVSLSTS